MIIRTIDNVFVNLDSVAKIRFNPESSETIEIVYPFKMEEDAYYYDVDYPLADIGVDTDDLNEIMDMFIDALKKNEPYFDFRVAYLRTCHGIELVNAIETMETYDGKRD